MTRTEIAARTFMVAENYNHDVLLSGTPVTEATSFTSDLGCDSLDLIDLTFALEREFDLDIPDEASAEMATVAAAIDWLAKRLGVDEQRAA